MEKDSRAYAILMIEDNLVYSTIIKQYLHQYIANPKIHHAKSYREASQMAHQKSLTFDAVLLDMTLPDKGGDALVREVVSWFPDIPKIILTGLGDTSLAIWTLNAGISDYLIKDDLNASMLYKSLVYNIQQKKTQTSLEESEKRYSDLFHFSPLPMWVYDYETLQLLDVNPAALKHYGYSEAEFLSMTIMDIRTEIEKINLQNMLAENRATNKPLTGIFEHLKKNGQAIQVDVHSSLIFFKGRKAKMVIANDVTEHLKYIKAVESQNIKLQEIAWIQSHVVRAPLARIMGLVNQLSEHQSCDTQKQILLQHTQKAACELDVVIKELVTKSEKI